jgi:hypothetical protein
MAPREWIQTSKNTCCVVSVVLGGFFDVPRFDGAFLGFYVTYHLMSAKFQVQMES